MLGHQNEGGEGLDRWEKRKGDWFKKVVDGGEREKNLSTKTKALNAGMGKEGEAVILECAWVQGPQWARTLDWRA